MDRSNTILVVDDEVPILEAYEHYLAPTPQDRTYRSSRSAKVRRITPLRIESYRLLLTRSGEQAIEIVEREREAGRRIAAGFFDMKMPGGMNGLETIRHIRSLDEDVLCTVVTAHQDHSIQEIKEAFGPDCQDEWDFLNKPFTQGELSQKARNMVSSWNRRRREEEQRQALERLITHLSDLRTLAASGRQNILEYVLDQLVAFTSSRGGLLATVEEGIHFRLAAGSLAWESDARALLERPDVAEQVDRSLATSQVVGLSDLSIVPVACVRAPRVVVLLDHAKPSSHRLRLVKIFAENAATALDNRQLHSELLELNRDLEARVADRTAALEKTNVDLEHKTVELESMLERLKEAESQLVQNEKLAVVGRLAACVAHEINNPAAYVLSNLQQLASYCGEMAQLFDLAPEEVMRWLTASENTRDLGVTVAEAPALAEEAIDGVRRIARTVRDLKNIGRVDPEGVARIRVQTVVAKALQILDNEIRHRADLSYDVGDAPPVLANEGHLLQVMMNLLLNATQASDEAGKGQIEISCREKDGEVAILVRDHGKGIPAQDLGRVFDPFFTTKPAGEGTGLGLSISRNLIESVGGRIAVASVLGEWTEFTVTLPVAAPGALARPPATKTPAQSLAPKGRLRLLFVDDEPGILRGYERQFGKRHDVVIAKDGREALEILQNVENIDLVFCDLMMPGVSGADVFREAVRRDPTIQNKFVVVTGGAFTPEAIRFLDEERPLQLQKPFGLDEIWDLLSNS